MWTRPSQNRYDDTQINMAGPAGPARQSAIVVQPDEESIGEEFNTNKPEIRRGVNNI